MKKGAYCALIAFCLGARAWADPVPVVMPEARIVACMNGGLSIEIISNATVAAYTTKTDYSGLTFEFQVRPKAAGDAAWAAVAGSVSPYREINPDNEPYSCNSNSTLYWNGASELLGDYELRGRVTHGVETSDWRVLPEFSAKRRLAGTVKDSRLAGPYVGKGSDGNTCTRFVDYYSTKGKRWLGLVMAKKAYVTHLRYVPISDYLSGAVVEAADDDEFTQNVREVLTIPSSSSAHTREVHELAFGDAVFAKAIRVVKPDTKVLGVTELEWGGFESIDANVTVCSESDYRACLTMSRESFIGYDSAVLERAYQPEGPFVELNAIADLSSDICLTDTVSAVGLACYYRVKGFVGAQEFPGCVSRRFVRPRQLERDAGDQTKLASGVSTLACGIYALPGLTVANTVTLAKAFDGDTSTYTDIFYYPDVKLGMTSIGVSLPTQAHIVGAYLRSSKFNNVNTCEKIGLYAARTVQDYMSTNICKLAAKQSIPDATKWVWYQSSDQDSLYGCAFMTGDSLSPASETWSYLRELRFVGYTEADEIASGKVLVPAGVALKGGVCRVTLSWTDAVNAQSMAVWRRANGAVEWTKVADGISPAALEYVDDQVRGGVTYEYRLVATGLDGLMSVTAEAGSVETQKRGMALILH